MAVIDVGSVYGVAVDVLNSAGALANPDTAALTITLPDGTTVTPTVPLPPAETGKLRYPYITSQSGRHTLRLVTTGPVTAYTDEFDVEPAVSGAIVSLADAKAQLNIPAADTSQDDELRDFIAGVTGAVEDYKNEVIAPRSFTEELELCRTRRFRVYSAPVLSLTSVQSWDGSVTWDVSDMRVSPAGVVRVMSGLPVQGLVEVTYQAGWNPIPRNYKRGALVVLQHVWETQRAGGVAGQGVIGREELRIQPGTYFTVPNKAKEFLGVPMPAVA